jgi:hypothetical protein
LLAQHIRFEQAPIRGEQRLEFLALRSANRLPAPQEQPAFPLVRVLASPRQPERILDAARRRVPRLHVGGELIEDYLGVFQNLAHRVEIRPVHVGAHGGDGRALAAGELLSVSSAVAAASVRSCCNPITSPWTTSESTVQ